MYTLVLILVKLSGSMWKLKGRIKATHSPFLKKVYIAIYERYQKMNNCWIGWDSIFESEPCLPHGLNGIFVSNGAKIGKNCVIFQQVTIGSNTMPDSKGIGAPTIGDNCYISAGAKVIGGITVGNHVRIGVNAVVYKDIPDNSVVVVGEQKIITKDEPSDNRFYSIHNGKWVYFDSGIWEPVNNEKILNTLNDPKLIGKTQRQTSK